jgi:hypothetical protein
MTAAAPAITSLFFRLKLHKKKEKKKEGIV